MGTGPRRGFGGGGRCGCQTDGRPGSRSRKNLVPDMDPGSLARQAEALESRLAAIKKRLGASAPGADAK